MKKIFAITTLFICLLAWDARADNAAPEGNTIYNPDPNHIWNRLNDVLFLRSGPDGKKYGLEEPDILYWVSTKNLLVEPSHSQALGILDEFINTHSERLV